MYLRGFPDHEPPVFNGSGIVELKGRELINFKMHAVPRDGADAFKRLVASSKMPYDPTVQFRLFVKDYDDVEWECGWTTPILQESSSGRWLLTGTLNSLTADISGDNVSKTSGAELVFFSNFYIPLSEKLIETATIGNKEVSRKISCGRHKCKILGAEIEISKEAWSENMWIISNTSDQFQHPYIENWLSEPLRVLCGNLIYPRLAARNFGDGKACIQIRRAPFLSKGILGLSGKLFKENNFVENFWEFYKNYLVYIAKWRASDGSPGFEANKITRFYEEIMQSAQGSRWMFSLSLASAIEGIVKILAMPDDMLSDYPEDSIDSLQNYIQSWKDSSDLKQRVLSDISRLRMRSIGSYLNKLVQEHIISAYHRNAWNEIRHEVMHGGLGNPWSDESTDKKVNKLLELVHILTIKLIGFQNQ